MQTQAYTPGHSSNATDFMAKRSFDSHGHFFADQLKAGLSVLDCGCGPGSITLGIAERVYPGHVVGIDFEASQIERAIAAASAQLAKNVVFQSADCYALPFGERSFDCVFSHALFEHLSDPARALREIHRVLRPGGVVGICSPDWGGFVLAPPSEELASAVGAYTSLQAKNGGDVEAGRKFGTYLTSTGFQSVTMTARYECYPSLELIGEYLALQLEREKDAGSAATFRRWSRSSGGLFAQAWISATGRKAVG